MESDERQSIGRLLLDRGFLSSEQLAVALRRQQELGGRLGTALLEMEAVSEDLLIRELAEQSSLPAADPAELRRIPDEVIELLPAKVAIRHRVVPFRAGRGRVDLAVQQEPDIPSADELAFVLGRRVVPYITNEARIYEALERYYGHGCPLRFSHLLERLNRQRDRPHEAGPPPARRPPTPALQRQTRPAAPAAAAATRPARPAQPSQPRPRPSSVPLSDDEKKSLRTRPAGAAVKPLSLEGVQQALEGAHRAEDIGTALLGFLGQEFLRVLVFRVGQGKVRGWMGRSPALDEYRFRNWTVSFEEPSVFLNLSQGAEFFLGKLPPMPAHDRLLKCWRGSLDMECAIFPVKVRSRLVCAVYGDRNSLGLVGLDVRSIQQLTAKAAIAFEMLLMQRKLRS